MDISGNVQAPPGMIALNTSKDYQDKKDEARLVEASLVVLIPIVRAEENRLFDLLSQGFSTPTAVSSNVLIVAIAAYKERAYRVALENYKAAMGNWDKNVGLPSETVMPSMPRLG